MVAAENGLLYLISAKNQVFEINPQDMTISYLKTLEDMPTGFTSNAVAVLNNGNLLISGNHKLL